MVSFSTQRHNAWRLRPGRLTPPSSGRSKARFAPFDIAAIAATHPEAEFVKKAAAAYPLKALQQLAIALLGAVGTVAVAFEHLEPYDASPNTVA
jgi:hypothetical protein